MTRYNTFTQDTAWSLDYNKDGDVQVMCGAMVVAIVPHSPGMFRPEARANANLIKSAPLMYGALTEAVRIATEQHAGDGVSQKDVDAWLTFSKQLLEDIK